MKNKKYRLSHEDYFNVRTWLESNRENLKNLSYRQIAEQASTEFGKTIPGSSIGEIGRSIGWVRKDSAAHTAEQKIEKLEEEIQNLKQAVIRLERMIFPTEPPTLEPQ